MEILDKHEDMVEVFARYITRNGKRIYPKNTRFFHFWVPAHKQQEYRKAKGDIEKEQQVGSVN